jgi:uncharacterized protein YndB with AHSA1/START domain
VSLIDQRIVIDAPPQIIWDYLADPGKVPQWHAGYRIVSVLTTRQTGAGTRRRCALTSGGKDVIEEITAWVDGVGYEYCVTEGGPYRNLQGRFRLQPSPEGTSVQWTVFYKPRGLFGLLQNQLRGKRQLSDQMASSLRQLKRRVDELGQRLEIGERQKVAIRGRLNAEERAQYQRRHAPAAADEAAPVPPPPPPDTLVPPAPPVVEAAPAVPAFVADLTAEPPEGLHTADTQPKAPPGLREAIKAQQEMQAVEIPADEPASVPPPAPPPVPPPAALVPPPPVPLAAVEPAPEYRRPTPPRGIPSVQPAPPESPAPAAELPSVPPPTPLHDTGEISIWEVFGLRRPSEQAQEVLDDLMRTVRTKQTAEMQRVIVDRRYQRPSRVRKLRTVMGLRLKQAIKRAHVRLQGK